MNDEFVVIIAPANKELAEEAFQNWLREQGFRAEDIPGDDLRIDVGRDAKGGTFYRYLIHPRWVKR